MQNQLYYRKGGGKLYRINTSTLEYEMLDPRKNYIERGSYGSLRQAQIRIDYMDTSTKEEHWRTTLSIARNLKRMQKFA